MKVINDFKNKSNVSIYVKTNNKINNILNNKIKNQTASSSRIVTNWQKVQEKIN